MTDFINKIAQIKRRGFSRPNRFEVKFSTPNIGSSLSKYGISGDFSGTICLQCESSQIPGVNVSTEGTGYVTAYKADYNNNTLTLVFRVGADMKEKKFFDAWIDATIDRDTFLVGYYKDYVTNIDIVQLDGRDIEVYTNTLVEAFPKTILGLDQTSGPTGEYYKLSVEFQFRKCLRKT